MKIQIAREAKVGDLSLPAGEYWVSINTEAQEFNLAGQGKDYKVPATRRRSNTKSKTTQIQFYSGGGNTWSLVVNVPNRGEWVAFLQMEKSDAK